MTPASTPPPEHNDEQIPDVRNPAAMREYIKDETAVKHIEPPCDGLIGSEWLRRQGGISE